MRRRTIVTLLAVTVALAALIVLKSHRTRSRSSSGDSDPPCMASHFGLPCR
ncbi:MAG TPA: hypothetical protein VIV65_03300 [Gemmatimonadaceae bacterium]|jgi:hypothetical protein